VVILLLSLTTFSFVLSAEFCCRVAPCLASSHKCKPLQFMKQVFTDWMPSCHPANSICAVFVKCDTVGCSFVMLYFTGPQR